VVRVEAAEIARVTAGRRYSRGMRRLSAIALTFVLAACAGDGNPAESGSSGNPGATTPGGGASRGVRGALGPDVFPFEAPPARFTTSQRGTVDLRLEPFEGGTAMLISGEGLTTRRIDWMREGGSLYCSDGPDRSVEFLRFGVMPGTSWESSGRTLRFEGWERVETPAGSFDAARISSTLAVEPYIEVETWWFAPEAGLVQMRVDKGELYSIEMKRIP
jgi:hypothetical protein